jgi:cell division protein FtsI/penicillin-binding protein 2
MPSRRSSARPAAGAWLLVGLAVALLVLLGRTVYIQHLLGPRLLARATQQQLSKSILPARRGSIVDARGRVLATTVSERAIFADPVLIKNPQATANKVAPVLGCHAAELLTKLLVNQSRRYVVLQRPASRAQAEAIDALRISGIGTEEHLSRSYPMGRLAAHVLGFVGREGRGLEGAELAFEHYLAGRDGYKTSVRDARRRALWVSGQGYRCPRDGRHVVLTIDAAIQEIAERELSRTVERYEAQAGCALVLNPHSGAVLALVNYPTYDPNMPGDFPLPSLRNRALTDPTEPGSTFKPFIAAAALSSGQTKMDEVFWCHQGYYPHARLRDHHPYGHLTLREVVIKSSNIGMALLGERLGDEKLHAICLRFGFGRRTGIELPGESAGYVLPVNKWTRPSKTRVTMGQGPITTTPLQLARAFCSFVNGGRLLRLTVLRAVLDSSGEVVYRNRGGEVVSEALSPAAAEEFARRVLLDVVREGTGRRAKLEHWHVLGKTGTAQLPQPGGGYDPEGYVGSFMAAAPAGRARLMAMVMVYRPNKRLGYYGGTVAAPAVGEILRQSLGYLEVAPDKFEPRLAGLAGR